MEVFLLFHRRLGTAKQTSSQWFVLTRESCKLPLLRPLRTVGFTKGSTCRIHL